MRQSELFGKTSKTLPKDIKLSSHKLLYQGGFIRELVSGRYNFLPLGQKVRENIIKIIKEEMDAAGAQQVATPTLHPVELWEKTNRSDTMSDILMTLKDNKDSTFILGATHEEVFVDLVKKFNISYKDLPFTLYQFSSKFRDELRARGGLLRVREFTMKDAYSFHATPESLDETYERMREAYLSIVKRLGLDVLVVEADSGAIGGKHSHEFIAKSTAGEDTVLHCASCGYAANREKANCFIEEINLSDPLKKLQEIQATSLTTIEKMSKAYKQPGSKMLKTVLYIADGKYIGAVIRGDLEINESKLAHILKIKQLELASDADIQKLGTYRGFISPIRLKGVKFVGDYSLKSVKNFYTGANKKDIDYENANFERDFHVDILGDIMEVKAGLPCIKCKNPLEEIRGIEFGHIFKLDHFYSKPMDARFVTEKGKSELLYMGCYGIGIERAIATIVEQHHDDAGIIWPKEVAPFQVHILELGRKDEAVQCYQTLQKAGFQVLYDDRNESAGSKFKDADLIGIPRRLVFSSRQQSGQVELKSRLKQEVQLIDWKNIIQITA